jgi:glutamate racemase
MSRLVLCSLLTSTFLVHFALADDEVITTAVERAAAASVRDAYRGIENDDFDDLPIGVFDSGTGGLTVLESILSIDAFDNASHTFTAEGDGVQDFRRESFIFLADQANMPYGNYPVVGKPQLLDDLIVKDAWFLMGNTSNRLSAATNTFESQQKRPVKAIVIACNTATAYGQSDIEEVIAAADLDIKVVGVIDAGAKGAVELLKDGRPGSLAVVPTQGTVLSNAYPTAIRRNAQFLGLQQRIDVFQQGALGLAGAIDGAREFILPEAKTNATRTDYRGPSMSNPEARIDPGILSRYAFDFSENRMLREGSPDDPVDLQLNSVENYISYHLVTLMEVVRTSENPPPLKGIVLGCTHFPFYRDVFDRELQRLRDYQEGGEYIYRRLLADEVVLIDPAYYTARELYESLAADGRMRAEAPQDQAAPSEFYITIPCRERPVVQLNEAGWFTYDYKYGRAPEQVESDFRVVPLDESNVDVGTLERLRTQVPSVWQLMNGVPKAAGDEASLIEQKINRIEKLIGEDIADRRGISPLSSSARGVSMQRPSRSRSIPNRTLASSPASISLMPSPPVAKRMALPERPTSPWRCTTPAFRAALRLTG